MKDADIFMEASKGGTWARKGITDDVLWELNLKMVIVHVSGFGQEGDPKMVKRAAYDLTVMAYSGIIMQNGTEEQPMLPGPTRRLLQHADDRLLGAGGLYKAEKSGKGESIDLAMYETLLAIGQYYLVDYLNEGIKWPRPGARNQNLCGIGEFKCKDGFWRACTASTRTSTSSRPSGLGHPGALGGHPRGHERAVAVQPARRRDPEGVRRVLPGEPRSTTSKRTSPRTALPPRWSTTWKTSWKRST